MSVHSAVFSEDRLKDGFSTLNYVNNSLVCRCGTRVSVTEHTNEVLRSLRERQNPRIPESQSGLG